MVISIQFFFNFQGNIGIQTSEQPQSHSLERDITATLTMQQNPLSALFPVKWMGNTTYLFIFALTVYHFFPLKTTPFSKPVSQHTFE